MEELEDVTELKFVEIKEGDKVIGYEAKPGVLSGVRVVVPPMYNGLPVIKIGGFQYNEEIEEVILPETIKEIGDYAFMCAYKLKSITLPKHLDKIGMRAFSDCEELNLSTLPEGIKIIPVGALEGTAMTEFVVPSTVKEIEDSALATQSLEVVEIPSNVKYLDSDAFYDDEGDVREYELTILCHKNCEKYVMDLKIFEGEDGYFPIMDQYRHHTYFIEIRPNDEIINAKYEPAEGFGTGATITTKCIKNKYIIKTSSGRYYKQTGFWAPKYRNYKN